jgi:hypothetical protein
MAMSTQIGCFVNYDGELIADVFSSSTSKICFVLGVTIRYGTLASPISPSTNSISLNLHEMRILHLHNKVFHKIQILAINLLYCWCLIGLIVLLLYDFSFVNWNKQMRLFFFEPIH